MTIVHGVEIRKNEPRFIRYLIARSKIDPVSGCWIWQLAADRDGYGRASVKKDHQRRWRKLNPEKIRLVKKRYRERLKRKS